MDRPGGQDHSPYPLVRIFTLGDFALERLVNSSAGDGEPLHYERIAPEVWANRGPAMTLLKILLCRAKRRASRGELTEIIWPGNTSINAAHALDSAASVLRRRVLATAEGGSLLLTLRSAGETIFKLPAQHRLWVDADALLEMVSSALQAELRGLNAIPRSRWHLLLPEVSFSRMTCMQSGRSVGGTPCMEHASGRCISWYVCINRMGASSRRRNCSSPLWKRIPPTTTLSVI